MLKKRYSFFLQFWISRENWGYCRLKVRPKSKNCSTVPSNLGKFVAEIRSLLTASCQFNSFPLLRNSE